VLVDAVLDPPRCGQVDVTTDPGCFENVQGHAHHLSAVQALALLRTVKPELAATCFTWVTVAVGDARISRDLSPAVAAAVPVCVDRILELVTTLQPPPAGESSPARPTP
jgi:Ni,Fe-hydrogenase maturation factor